MGVLQEAVAEMRVVQAFTREEYEAERFHSKLLFMFRKTMERARTTSVMFPLIGFLGFASSIVVLWFGGHEVANGELTTGQLVAFLLYLGMVSGPIGGLAGQWGAIQQAFGAADRLFSLLDAVPEVRDAPDAIDLPPVRGEIRFSDVKFRYGDGPIVLDGVTTAFGEGQTTALVGPSGAGKTTLVNLVGRFYDPVAGAIAVDGYDLQAVKIKSLRSQIAVVPQEPILFADTIRENIRYGRLEATNEEIDDAAAAANATEFISRLPKGMDTIVGERGVRLSVGQRQRVAIARALLRDAPILLLDEATSSLDNESEFLVQQALDRLMRGRTTIVIAHRLSTVERAHRILVLDRGRIVETGRHAQLLARNGLYARLYETQFASEQELVTTAGAADAAAG
jgi:subfamily B ATP-binding cassette protein MsbA